MSSALVLHVFMHIEFLLAVVRSLSFGEQELVAVNNAYEFGLILNKFWVEPSQGEIAV